MSKRVGFIGLGIMGMPMARNLLKAGFQLVVYNRTRARAEELAPHGAAIAGSPRQVAEQADITLICVTDSSDVQQVVLGPDGVVQGIRPGSLVIDTSTISPKVAREVAEALKQKGGDFLDAPLTGGSWGAVQGTLTIMVGGEEAAFQRALPVLQAVGKKIVHMGPSGAGQTTKLVNQIIVVGNLLAACEGLVFAARAGLDMEKCLEVVTSGAANSWQLQNLGPRMLRGDFAPGFMVRLQQKDLRLVLEAAEELRVPLFSASLVHQLFRSLEASAGDEGTQALVKVLEHLAGVEARTGGSQPR